MVTQSVVVFIVRRGNPKQIATWEDLLAEGVEIVTPSVLSQAARWTVLAAYGAQIVQGKSAEEATDYVQQLSAHGAPRDYRPILPAVQAEFHFPVPVQAVMVGNLGGWEDVDRTFFAPDSGLVAQIQPVCAGK